MSFETLVGLNASADSVLRTPAGDDRHGRNRGPSRLRRTGVPAQAVVHRRRKDLPDTPASAPGPSATPGRPAKKAQEAELRYIKIVFVTEGESPAPALLKPVSATSAKSKSSPA